VCSLCICLSLCKFRKITVRHPSVIVIVGGFKHVNATETCFEDNLTPIHVVILLLLLFSPLHFLLLLLEHCSLFWTLASSPVLLFVPVFGHCMPVSYSSCLQIFFNIINLFFHGLPLFLIPSILTVSLCFDSLSLFILPKCPSHLKVTL